MTAQTLKQIQAADDVSKHVANLHESRDRLARNAKHEAEHNNFWPASLGYKWAAQHHDIANALHGGHHAYAREIYHRQMDGDARKEIHEETRRHLQGR